MSFAVGKSRVLLVVTDGLGYSPQAVASMAEKVWESLLPKSRLAIARAVEDADVSECLDNHLIALMAVVPRWVELVEPDATAETARTIAEAVQHVRSTCGHQIANDLLDAWQQIGNAERYVPWVAEVPKWSEIVNRNLTFPTRASGIWAGYEDVDPPVQGNSETGHQQIGNLALAPQVPLEITESINDGSFYENPIINDTISRTLAGGGNINICFLLSGITGSDGRVHSAWNHLEAMLELLFGRLNLPAHKVRLQAIADGRDAPADGFLHFYGTGGGYLGELQRLLNRYEAEESLAWVVGRSIAMDRDYREDSANANYRLLIEGAGIHAHGFDDVRAIVEDCYSRGATDADIPPIFVCTDAQDPATISSGDAFINLNFRSDRQRAVTATLAIARDYLTRESSARGRQWSMHWMRDDLQLNICTIADYDPEFSRRYGVQVAYPTRPHALNFVSAWDKLVGDESTYLLAAESVKASHMGYFIRGRREMPECPDSEVRWITPSASAEEGVNTDSDYYKVPAMKTAEIVDRVKIAMFDEDHRLIICNLAAPDMVGHLLPNRLDAAVEACRVTCEALVELSETAARAGVHMVVTSDHGNIESDAPTHTANPVLTTVIPCNAETDLQLATTMVYARLYDIPHTIAHLLGIAYSDVQHHIESSGGAPEDPRFRGESLIR